MSRAPDRAYVVWAVGLLVYVVAVFHRSSLAVAGLVAVERFDISASALATFTMLQLVVYTAMQIPVGLLVDRFGSRSVVLCGIVLMVLGQASFALATGYGAAVAARILVGMGDALTFISVLRLISSWFPVRRIPLMTQLTGTLGQLGAIVAAVPMTWALRGLGWTGAYLVAASVSVLLAIVVPFVLDDSPTRRSLRGAALSLAGVRRSLALSWAHPGTRLGFWMHFTTQFSATALALLWGYPFFVQGEHRSAVTAGLLLTLMVLAAMVAGPTLGWLVAAHPWHRSTLVIVIVLAITAVWTVVLAWPARAPVWLLVLLVVVAGVGSPASMVAFDVGRTSNPSERLASASAIINQGGYIASLILVISIGVVLDWRTPGGGDRTPEAFRWAMCTQYLLWGLGLVQLCRYRVRTRAVTSRDELEGIV